MGSSECIVDENFYGSQSYKSVLSDTKQLTLPRLPIKTSKACGGDFCNFLVKNSYSGKAAVDYDDLLRKVRLAYIGENGKEVSKIRLGLTLDYL